MWGLNPFFGSVTVEAAAGNPESKQGWITPSFFFFTKAQSLAAIKTDLRMTLPNSDQQWVCKVFRLGEGSVKLED